MRPASFGAVSRPTAAITRSRMKETKMRVILLNELTSLTSVQLLELYRHIAVLLKELPESSDDYLNAVANLRAIRWILARRHHVPS
jgi:hypothetical protein